MTTFYDRAPIRITERWLSVGHRRYPIDHLDDLHRTRGRADRTARRAALTAALSLPANVAIGPNLPAPAAMAAVLALVVLPALVAAHRAGRYRRPHVLWAAYRGAPTRLYQTRDGTEFGKICRALVRARSRWADVSDRQR